MARKKPTVVGIAGERHETVVLRIIEWDDDGSPRAFRRLKDDESADLSRTDETKNHFWIVYAPGDIKTPGQRTSKNKRN